jgi:uncharacterized short protein YbdD (DUF466 family)
MICRCFGKTLDLTSIGVNARRTARSILGVPDYDAYVTHLRTAHPEQTPPTQAEFISARQQARFVTAGLRCC